MTLFQRIGDTISANLNNAVESVGKPDVMARYYADKAGDELNASRNRAASIMADRMAIEREIASTKIEIEEMQSYAEKAMKAGNKEDARKFLETKASLTNKLSSYERALGTQKESERVVLENYHKQAREVEAMEADMREIQANVTVAVSKDASGTYASESATRATRMFRRMKDRSRKMVDEATAKEQIAASNMPVAALIDKYSGPNPVDAELAALEASCR